MVIELIFLGNITYLRVQLGVLDHIYVFSSLRDKKMLVFVSHAFPSEKDRV